MNELQHGRKLDALVAERVMGWKPPGWLQSDNINWFDKDGNLRGEGDIPAYSTDPAAAMAVWETLPKPRRLHETPAGVVVMCGGRSLGPDTDFIYDAIAMGGTVPHAVCLAALRATEVRGGSDGAG